MRVGKLLPAGAGIAAAIVRRAPTVPLDWNTRQKSRFAARDSLGRELAVFLARGQVVRGGDLLLAEDGSLLRVVAADQPVLVVTAPDGPAAARELTRAAYHLGNRHVSVEIRPDHLKIEPDPAEVSIGLNKNVVPTGSMRTDKKMYATSHIGLGDTVVLGGTCHAKLRLEGVIRYPEISVDGQVLTRGGRILLDD